MHPSDNSSLLTVSSLYTVVEAAKFLRLKPPTLYLWIRKRRIEYVRIGSRAFLRRETLERLIESGTVPANGESSKPKSKKAEKRA